MRFETRHHVVIVVILLALAGVFELLLGNAVLVPNSSTRADAWARTLSTREKDYAARNVEEYPFAYRKALIRYSTPDERSRIFRSHLARYQANHPELGAEQRSLIERVSSVLSPDQFDRRSQGSTDALRSLEFDSARLFTPVALAEIFYRLGPEVKESAFARLSDWISKRVVVHADGEPLRWCECNVGSSYPWQCGGCSRRASCRPYAADWYEEYGFWVWEGCGFSMQYDCDGLCGLEEI